jgi:CO/xanthine dehydrogenase Mo-binding subunit
MPSPTRRCENRRATPTQRLHRTAFHARVDYADGTQHVCTPNKSPFKTREFMAQIAGLPLERVIVESTANRRRLRPQRLTTDEFPCYFLAKATGPPVRYVESYIDELMTGSMRPPAHITLKIAVARDGTFLAHISDVT